MISTIWLGTTLGKVGILLLFVTFRGLKRPLLFSKLLKVKVTLEGIEPPTFGLGNRCSILLSYRALLVKSRIYRPSSPPATFIVPKFVPAAK